MRKKFFVTDSFVDIHRSAALHMLYLECKHAVVSGQYLTTLEHALQARGQMRAIIATKNTQNILIIAHFSTCATNV